MKHFFVFALLLGMTAMQLVSGQTLSISQSATSICANSGTMVTLTAVTPTGTPLTYTWSNGTTGIDYIEVSPTSTSTYTVTVTFLSGGPLTASATVTVLPTPNPVVTPGTAAFCAGSNVVLASTIAGPWYRDGIIITGATGLSYTATTAGSYTVFVTVGGCSGESTPVTVTVNPLPDASFTPTSILDECPDAITPFTANLTGPNYTYQWYRSVNTMGPTNPGTAISGATSATYTPNAILDQGTYYFSVRVYNTLTGCWSSW